MIGALLLSLVAATPRCQVPPAAQPDPAAASAYLEVGKEELAKGDFDAAEVALREAARLDPKNAEAQAAWSSLCDRTHPPTLELALSQMKERDFRAAIDTLIALRRKAESPTAALLQAECHYELGEDDAARAALQVAAKDRDLRETVALYTGLIAVRQGRTGDATAALMPLSNAADPLMAEAAVGLLRAARDEGRLVVGVGAELNHDTAAYPYPLPLLPNGYPDQAVAVVGTVVLRPLGADGPFVRAHALYRDMIHLDFFDSLHAGAGAGWQFGTGVRSARIEYGYDWMSLGGSPYFQGHRLELGASWAWGNFGVRGSYSGRYDVFNTTYTAYDGLEHEAALFAEYWLGSTALAVGYRGLRSEATTVAVRYLEQGPRVVLRFGAGGSKRLRLEGGYVDRPFDAWATGPRQDRFFDGMALAEFDLDPTLQLNLSVIAQRQLSNQSGFSYTRLVGAVGLSWTTTPW